MTQHLETLKGILQKALNSSTESEDFIEALTDGVYACDLNSVLSLETWLDTWNGSQDVDYLYGTGFSKQYQEGVQFVAEQWDRILSEGGEGEE